MTTGKSAKYNMSHKKPYKQVKERTNIGRKMAWSHRRYRRRPGRVRVVRMGSKGSAEDQTLQMLKIKPQHDAPVLKYKRCGTIEENDRSCVLKSAASALSYLGYTARWNCILHVLHSPAPWNPCSI
jgi:hypothetical protein